MSVSAASIAHSDSTSAKLGPAALFFDVDGTLVSHDQEGGEPDEFMGNRPRPAIYDAFERLSKNGHKAFICTGRPLCLISKSLLDLPTAGLVTGAGAVVSMGGEILHEESIPYDLMERTIRLLETKDLTIMLESTDQCVVLSPNGEVHSGFEYLPHAKDLEGIRAVNPELHVTKLSFYEDAFQAIGDDLELLKRDYDLFDLGLGYYDMTLKGVDKGAGVRRAIELLDEPPSRTYAFGDSENDLAMLRAVDVPVAMGNALESVKAMAAYVTDSVNEDGVATGLEHFGLI